MLDVLSKTYGKGVSAEAQKLKTPQPHAPDGSRRFYLAVLIERPTSTPRYDISLLRNRASHVSRMQFMRAPIARGCVGQRPPNRRAPVENSALGQRCGRQSDGIVCAADRMIY